MPREGGKGQKNKSHCQPESLKDAKAGDEWRLPRKPSPCQLSCQSLAKQAPVPGTNIMNAGILPETPRRSQGTRPRSLDQRERQEDESSQELSWWMAEGNVSMDLLGSPQSSQERLELTALPTSFFPSDSPQKLSQPGLLGGGTTWINNEFEGGNKSKQTNNDKRAEVESVHKFRRGVDEEATFEDSQIPSGK